MYNFLQRSAEALTATFPTLRVLSNATRLEDVPVVEVDGVMDAIQELDNAIMQLANHAVLDETDETDEMIAGKDQMVFLEDGNAATASDLDGIE